MTFNRRYANTAMAICQAPLRAGAAATADVGSAVITGEQKSRLLALEGRVPAVATVIMIVTAPIESFY